MSSATRPRARWPSLDREPDAVAVEEPLEIRLSGEPLLVTMRTPGADRELTLGFLFAEGLIAGVADVGSIAHCGRPGEEGYGNLIEVRPAPGFTFDATRSARGTLTTAACGVCGRRSIDDLLERIQAPDMDRPALDPARLVIATEQLAAHQPIFEETGGVHGALLLDAEDRVLSSAEDVGRHNAVDKTVGHTLLAGTQDAADLLVVSGRVSFEIVQKAAASGVRGIAAMGAPTTLAIDLARRARIALAGFCRAGRGNVYG